MLQACPQQVGIHWYTKTVKVCHSMLTRYDERLSLVYGKTVYGLCTIVIFSSAVMLPYTIFVQNTNCI